LMSLFWPRLKLPPGLPPSFAAIYQLPRTARSPAAGCLTDILSTG
jgi:hypothetical protein